MKTCKHLFALGGSAVLALASFASAETLPTTGDADVRAEMAAMKARIAELESKQNVNWLDERKAEQVKGLVREILADADTRASLLQDGATAGHNGKHFFLASEDGSFLLEIGGQIQVRWIYNNGERLDDGDDDIADDESGFSVPRGKVWFRGHIADPRLNYKLTFAVKEQGDDSDTQQAIILEEAWIGYDITDTLRVWGGERKGPFMREEMTASSHQLAVERSLVNEIFTMGYIQGVGLIWDAHEHVRAQVAISDGIRSGEPLDTNDADLHKGGPDGDGPGDNSKVFNADGTDFAITARVDVRLTGDWAQAKDFTAWGGEEMAIFIGGAVHQEYGKTGTPSDNNDFFSWTVDASVETNGLGLYAAVVGLNTDYDSFSDRDLIGIVLQGSYNINDKLEPFIRYEYIDFDGNSDSGPSKDRLELLTFGANYYFNKHNAKLTVDLVWALDEIPEASGADGLGFESEEAVLASVLGLKEDDDDEENQIALRIQFQLLF